MRDLLAIAEAPAAHIVPRHPAVAIEDGYVVSDMGVQGIRLDSDEVDEACGRIRAAARDRGLESISWWTSDLTRPPDLGERLGLEPGEILAALALTKEPEGAGTFAVHRVETLDDFIAAQAIDRVSSGHEPDEDRDRASRVWERLRDLFMLWLATDDGHPVGMGRAARADDALMLIGGATLPDERGRGVYRSLVHARWRAAVELGTPALVVAANTQSAPILERLGFERLGEIRTWIDRL